MLIPVGAFFFICILFLNVLRQGSLLYLRESRGEQVRAGAHVTMNGCMLDAYAQRDMLVNTISCHVVQRAGTRRDARNVISAQNETKISIIM